ncbi:MAG: SDR family oxidoreductase [Chloroflexia bacterium]|nr:SDR family oxidoreductase [Chloroflexia bacterium]
MRLEGKTAIITGAASGIGAGTAEIFAEQGARLVLVDWNRDGLEEVRASLAGVADHDVLLCVGNVAERRTAELAMAMAASASWQVDILFNNAGIMESPDFLASDDEAWDRLMAINLRGMMLMARAVLPGMVERGAGSIVNTSSVMAFLTEPNYEAYTTSKAAIIGFTKSLAVTYAERGIRSNCICPGWVDTPMNRQLAEEMGGLDKLTPIIRQQQPLGRMVTTREVAHAVLFLASDDASGVTGATLNVDGAAGSSI